MNQCQYCKKNYSSKYILEKHQKTTKSCLKIQQQLNDQVEIVNYSCEFCNKTFTSKQSQNKHNLICPKKFEHEINRLNQKITELTDKLTEAKENIIVLETENNLLREQSSKTYNTVEEIAKQPRNQVNNNQKVLITSSIDLSQEKMKDMIDNSFNADYMIQGQKGVAKFAYDTILKDEEGKLKYICTDPSRQIFQYKNCEGEIQKDVKAKKLTKALLDGELKSASHKIASDKMKDNSEDFLEYSTYYLDIKELEDDNSDFSKELSTLVI